MNSLSFNGLRKPYLLVTKRKRSYWAPRELVLTQNRKTGSRLRNIKTGIRVEEVHVEITEAEGLDIRKTVEDFAGWLLTETEEELIFDDETDRRYYAVVDGNFDADEIVTVGYGIIRFVCPDSYKYGAEKMLNLTNEIQTYNILGQAETPWISTTTFTVPQSKFTLESNAGKITLNYDFIAGDVLEINYETRDIFVSGINIDVGLTLDSVWFDLKPGEMCFKASHVTTLKYDERYY